MVINWEAKSWEGGGGSKHTEDDFLYLAILGYFFVISILAFVSLKSARETEIFIALCERTFKTAIQILKMLLCSNAFC